MSETKAADQLIDLALERAQYEYTELAENWKLLDAKAQGTAAIAGIFLAAFVAFVSKDPCSVAGDIHTKLAVAVLLFLLLASILFAVTAMRVIGFDMPPSGRSTRDDVAKLLDLPLNEDELRAERTKLLRELTEIWLSSGDTIENCNAKKVKLVQRAQRFLVWAAFFIAALALWRILI